jgi:hypothetical protein
MLRLLLLALIASLPVDVAQAQGKPMGPWLGNDSRYWPIRWNTSPDSAVLFLNCENRVLGPAPARGKQVPLTFTATGATVRVVAKERWIYLVPTAATVTLWARRGKALVFKHVFRAMPPPLPEVKCFCGEVTYCFSRAGQTGYLASLKAVPVVYFAALMPEDARYRVARFQVSRMRNKVAIGAPMTFTSEANLGSLVEASQPGDELQIDVKLVQRLNFLN